MSKKSKELGKGKLQLALSLLPCYDCLNDGYVAQLDRASDSGSEGRGFEPLHTRDKSKDFLTMQVNLC